MHKSKAAEPILLIPLAYLLNSLKILIYSSRMSSSLCGNPVAKNEPFKVFLLDVQILELFLYEPSFLIA
jgi:hypothetical protein